MIINRVFNNFSIAKKITTIIAASAIATGVLSGIAGSLVAKNNMMNDIALSTSELNEQTIQKANLYLNGVKNDLLQLANSSVTVRTINEFNDAWNSLKNPQKHLQKHYVTKNPYPNGEKDKLISASDDSFYSETHKNYHDSFLATKDIKGYYDIFLINKNGDVVYSVYKEADYATNLNTGQWKDTDLGNIFHDINKNPQKGTAIFKDFKEYAPSNNLPASFIGTPIVDKDNNYHGVMVFQMPVDKFSSLFESKNTNNAIYLVGSDGTLRNDLQRTKNNDILSTKSKIENIEQLQGKFFTNLQGLIFPESVYNIKKLSFLGTDWTLVSENNQTIIDKQASHVTLYSFLAAMVTSLLVACLGFLYARSFARPIAKLADTVDKLANGYDCDIPCKDNRDELGTLARSLMLIHSKSQESARVEAAVNGADAMLMIADESFKIAYANNKVKESLKQSRDYFKTNMSSMNINELEGNNLIDLLSNDIPNIQNILKDLHKAHSEKLAFDNRHFNVTLTPVYDKSGNRIGFVTEWLEKTAEVKQQEHMEKRKIQEQQIEAQVAEVIQAAASGNFKERLNINDDRQSIITISNGINKICDTVDSFFNDLNDTVHSFAEGDLTKSLQGNYSGQFDEVKESLNQSFHSLCSTIKEIATVGNAIKAASSDITTGADDLSGRTEAQAASIEQTVATMEEMSASVRNNANSAVQASSLAQETLQQAENGRNVVSQAVVAMNQIETSAHRITEIVSVIDSIASQTNLLALNAAVEAARAGEAGKGFAVVASEVRTLASRCSEAARDIRGLITGSNAQVVDGVKLVNATGIALSQIVESVTNVTATISSISQASREQATGIEEISGAISQMDEITQQNAGLADNSAANARELSQEAESLSDLVRAFKTETASSMLSSVNKKLSAERPTSTKSKPAKSSKKPEASFDNFSDFGTASGDDWSDL